MSTKIIEIELKQLYGRVSDLGYKLKIKDAAKDFIVEKGFDAKFGARPLKRAIQKYIEDSLAEEIIKSEIKKGDLIDIGLDAKKQELTINVTKGKSSNNKKSNGSKGKKDIGTK